MPDGSGDIPEIAGCGTLMQAVDADGARFARLGFRGMNKTWELTIEQGGYQLLV